MSGVLVTGGAGFIGAAIASALSLRGDRPVCAFDLAFASDVPLHPGVHRIVGDVTDAAGVIAAVHSYRIDRIVHTAAIVGIAPSVQMAPTVIRTNLDGTINVFEAARILGVRRVLHLSSEEVYGEYADTMVDENAPTFPPTPYGATKLAAEHFSRAWRTMHGLDTINLRVAWAYGPGLPRARVPRILVDAIAMGRELHLPEGGDACMDHTHVDDIVAGVLAALDHDKHRYDTYNLGTGNAPPVSELVAILRGLAPGCRLSVGPGPMMHPGGHAMPRKGALDIARARAAFGYAPRVDLRTGLSRYLEWARARAAR